MHYLINPGGRIVEVENNERFEELRVEPGYRIPSDELVRDYISKRLKLVEEIKNSAVRAEELKSGIYMATVTQGGKDGYGVSSATIISEMERLGMPVSTYYAGQKIGILYHNPYSIHNVETPYKIIYTMFESDKIPNDWRQYLEAAHKVLVPSHWCQRVFKESGIESTVIPLGYDARVFKYMERENKRKARKDFVFLHYNAFNIRKGFPEVFKAFKKAFRVDEPVRLVLKTSLQQPPIPIYKEQYPNIDVICGQVSELKLSQILQSADCFVFPSRGEGFGITPLEAMATGMPAIVPNAHGITEYFDPEYMYEAKVKETCPGLYTRYKGMDVGKMVVCDVDQLAAQMRYIYEHQEEAAEVGKKASEYVKQWTFERTARLLKGVVDEVLAKPLPPPKVINYLPLKKV